MNNVSRDLISAIALEPHSAVVFRLGNYWYLTNSQGATYGPFLNSSGLIAELLSCEETEPFSSRETGSTPDHE
jgi:hypothetical protein